MFNRFRRILLGISKIVGSITLFPPPVDLPKFKPSSPEEINRKAWELTGKSMRKSIEEFEKVLDKELTPEQKAAITLNIRGKI